MEEGRANEAGSGGGAVGVSVGCGVAAVQAERRNVEMVNKTNNQFIDYAPGGRVRRSI